MPLWLQNSLNWCCIPHCRVKCVQAGNCAENPVDFRENDILMALLRPVGLSFHAAQNHRKPGVKRDICPPPVLNHRQGLSNVLS